MTPGMVASTAKAALAYHDHIRTFSSTGTLNLAVPPLAKDPQAPHSGGDMSVVYREGVTDADPDPNGPGRCLLLFIVLLLFCLRDEAG